MYTAPIIFCFIILIVLAIPYNEYPDQIRITTDGFEAAFGMKNQNDRKGFITLSDQQKLFIKVMLVISIGFFGLIITGFLYYLHKKSILWCEQEVL